MKQKTILKEVSLEGPGLHFGKKTCLKIKPAKENTGYVFIRTDLDKSPKIPALAEYVSDTSRGTTIVKENASVSTIEHLLAATYSLGIDNVIFEINGPEVPILDGSSKYFIEALHKAGIKEQNADLVIYNINENLSFIDEERDIEISVFPDSTYKLKVLVDYKSDILSNQYAFLNNLKDFTNEVSSCRTFVFLSELEPLLRLNLIKGGDLDNAIVIVDKESTQEEFDRLAKLFNKPSVAVQSSGVLNNLKLQFTNEPARHKLLDIIGDLALTGYRFNGSVLARRPGHFGNTEMAKLIRKHIKTNHPISSIPQYRQNSKPLMDINKVKSLLPQRYPFLFVDKIMSITDNEIVGIKNVSNDEYYFEGHFPNQPIMPEVLQLEAIKQASTILLLNNISDIDSQSIDFPNISNIYFNKPVVPGDVLVIKVSQNNHISNGISSLSGNAYVGTELVCKAEIKVKIVKQND